MKTWTSDELDKIGTSEELEIASMRSDGTLRKSVTIWVARIGGDLYVRSVNGRDGSWFRGTQVRHEGHIQAGGIDKEVSFVDADSKIYDLVDAAYRNKYRHYSARIVNTILTPEARDSTLKLLPR